MFITPREPILACGSSHKSTASQEFVASPPVSGDGQCESNAPSSASSFGSTTSASYCTRSYKAQEGEALLKWVSEWCYTPGVLVLDINYNDQSTQLHRLLSFSRGKYPPSGKVEELIKLEPEALQIRGLNGQLPIHWACLCNFCLPIIEALLNGYPESVTVTDEKGWLPIHHLCSNAVPNLHVIQALLNAHPECIQVRDKDAKLPIHHVCSNTALDQFDFIQALVNAYPESIQVRDKEGKLPIHHVCSNTTPDLYVIGALVNAYPESIQVRDEKGKLPLYCAYRANPGVLNFLIVSHREIICQVKINSLEIDTVSQYTMPGRRNRYPWRRGNVNIIPDLIEAYPKSSSVQDNHGKSPFEYLRKSLRKRM